MIGIGLHNQDSRLSLRTNWSNSLALVTIRIACLWLYDTLRQQRSQPLLGTSSVLWVLHGQ